MTDTFNIKIDYTYSFKMLFPSINGQSLNEPECYDAKFKKMSLSYVSNNPEYDLCICLKYQVGSFPDYLYLNIKHDANNIFNIDNDTIIINLDNYESNSSMDYMVKHGIIIKKLSEIELIRFNKWYSTNYNLTS